MVEEPSALHIVIASNNDWPIPAEWDDRRFFALDVSEAHKQDEGYFTPLVAELEQGGRAAMLHDLLAHVVDWAALRHPPDTDAKRDLKSRSMSGDDRWLINWLMDDLGTWEPKQARSVVYEDYSKSFARGGSPTSIDGLERFFTSIFKRAKIKGDWPRGTKKSFLGKRVNAWEFPVLSDFRTIVDTALGTETEWPSDPAAPTLLAQPEEEDNPPF